MGFGWWWIVLLICSFSNYSWGAGVEGEELKIAVGILRKENAELRKELAAATNRTTRVEIGVDGRMGLLADADDVRSASEWKSFLLEALKVLQEDDKEILALQKRLGLLIYSAQEALKTAEKVDPSKRVLLEGEIRQSNKMLEGRDEFRGPSFSAIPNNAALAAAKVMGVRLDLGVAAITVGYKDGVRVGMPFLVFRGKTVLAVLTVVEVRDRASLVVIDKMEPEKPIQEGDVAIVRRM